MRALGLALVVIALIMSVYFYLKDTDDRSASVAGTASERVKDQPVSASLAGNMLEDKQKIDTSQARLERTLLEKSEESPTSQLESSLTQLRSAFADGVSARLESALQNNIYAVLDIYELGEACRRKGRRSAERFENDLQDLQWPDYPLGTPGAVDQEEFENDPQLLENRARKLLLRGTYCGPLALDNRQRLVGELSKKAQSGNPAARFLAVMLDPPNQTPISEWQAIARRQENAWSWTNANLEEGHPLGLVTMSQAHHLGLTWLPMRSTEFLPAYALAALACGADHHVVRRVLGQKLRYPRISVSDAEVADTLIERASLLLERHCADWDG